MASNNNTTIIAVGTHIKGEIIAKSNLHIDGVFEGKILSDSIISIGQGGIASGEIIAQKLIVSGKFHGQVDALTIEVMPNGRVDGIVITDELVIEREGFFIGESKMRKNSPALPKPEDPMLDKPDKEAK